MHRSFALALLLVACGQPAAPPTDAGPRDDVWPPCCDSGVQRPTCPAPGALPTCPDGYSASCDGSFQHFPDGTCGIPDPPPCTADGALPMCGTSTLGPFCVPRPSSC